MTALKKIVRLHPKQTIGRREIVDFPDLGLFGLIAKIDTGANTTALHCHHVRVENGVLFFRLLDESHPEYVQREQRFEKFEEKLIKSSFGQSELRYVVHTTIVIGKRKIKSIVSLSDRANMRYPVLIGRRFLKNRFNVDVSLLNALSPNQK
ncbi:MAG: RimK/LysX family protein [Bacteroidetes bacterium]|nr:RimK/LysX family protein [Bacteroidota bacterium]